MRVEALNIPDVLTITPVRHAIVVIRHYCSELCLAHWENSKTRS